MIVENVYGTEAGTEDFGRVVRQYFEKWKLKGKGATAEEALAEFEAMLERVEAEYGNRVRGFQPDRDGEADQ